MIKNTFTVDVSIPQCIYNFSFFIMGSNFDIKIYEILDGCIHKTTIETGNIVTFSATYDELEDAALAEHDLGKFFKTTCEEYQIKFEELTTGWPESLNAIINNCNPASEDEQQAVLTLLVRRRVVWDMMNDLVEEFAQKGTSFDLHTDGFSVDGGKVLWDNVVELVRTKILTMGY